MYNAVLCVVSWPGLMLTGYRWQWVRARPRSLCSCCRSVLRMANGCVSRTCTWSRRGYLRL